MATSYPGVACSSGVAVAPAWQPRAAAVAPPTADVDPAGVAAAFSRAADRLLDLATSFRDNGATTYADILEAESFIARDPMFADEVATILAAPGPHDPEAAVMDVTERYAAVMEAVEAENLRERAGDIREVGRRVVDELLGRVRPAPPQGELILLDEEVSAPDLLEYADHLVGAVSVRGGASSHASIVARSLGIPLVALVNSDLLSLGDGEQLLVDGDTGKVEVDPTAESMAAVSAATAPMPGVNVGPLGPATTRDGVEVTVLANVASAVEAQRALAAGADGVGLLRTELAFLAAQDWPTTSEHERSLQPILEILTGHPVTVRILDFSNDKRPPFLADRVVGSSLTLLLRHPDALDAQLRAIATLGRGCDVRVLVPMVTTADDLDAVRGRLAALVGKGRLPSVGAMIELPAAVENLAALLPAADFLSIGSNDLTAATFGLERTDRRLTPELAAHPDVLRQVERVTRLGTASGMPVAVCGDAAANETVLPLLLGAGVSEVSVSPSRIAAVRDLISEQSQAECAALLSRALDPGAVTARGDGPHA
jgi:phosphoenolpyruvate-protein kinase (PTS system EI component)